LASARSCLLQPMIAIEAANVPIAVIVKNRCDMSVLL
jgi:hypothetical protein